MSATVKIFNTVEGSRVPRRKLRALADMVLKAQRRQGEVNLVFVNDRRMAQLNKQFRERQGTTDVLSFSLAEDGDPLAGEIYISIPRAKKQAVEFGHSTTREILKLACHGLLHLCDMHHPNENARRDMIAAEQRFLKRLETHR